MYGRVSHVLRLSSVATPRLSAAFTTTTTRLSLGSATKHLTEALQTEAEAKQAEPDIPVSRVPLKPLRPGKAIRPHQLAYESRVPSNPFAKKPTVAPTSKQARAGDIFYQLSIDPLSVATNASILSEYVTEMGQIRPRTQTKLTVKSQRKLGKAIRRARMMGVLPLLSRSVTERR